MRMTKRVALGLLVGILVAFAVGTLYYWRVSQPYRERARLTAEEAERDLAAIAKMKDFDPVTMRRLKEKQAFYRQQSNEIEAMRQRARLNARIAAGAAGIAAFAGSITVAGLIRLKRGRTSE